MFGLNKFAFGVLVTGVVGAFAGYCIYFDYQRRSDPNYKKKVHERRRRMRERAQKEGKTAGSTLPGSDEEIYRFFLHEVHLGEQEIARGNLTNGVEHLAQAVAVCEQPTQLLQLMQHSLPPQGFLLLVQKLQSIQAARMARAAEAQRAL